MSTAGTIAEILDNAQRGANKTAARAATIKTQIDRCRRKMRGLYDELYQIEPQPWSERFGDNLGTIATGLAGRR